MISYSFLVFPWPTVVSTSGVSSSMKFLVFSCASFHFSVLVPVTCLEYQLIFLALCLVDLVFQLFSLGNMCLCFCYQPLLVFLVFLTRTVWHVLVQISRILYHSSLIVSSGSWESSLRVFLSSNLNSDFPFSFTLCKFNLCDGLPAQSL